MTERRAGYVELHCHSVFSLLDGASEPEALVARAVALGMPALALTDHDDLGGAVRFAFAARELGLAGILGAELTVLAGGERTHLVALAESREGYGNLSALITRARMDTTRGDPAVTLDTLARHTHGLFALTGCPGGWVPRRLAAGDAAGANEALATLVDLFDGRVAVECWDHRLPEERALVRQLIPLARSFGIPWVVTNDVHYAMPAGRLTHDTLTAIRHQLPLDEMGTRLRPNGEWYLRGAAQMQRRWQLDDTGIRNTSGIAERCTFRLADLKPALPDFPLPPGVSADDYLMRLVEQGVRERILRSETSPKTRDQRPKPSHESRVTSHGSIPDSRFPIPDLPTRYRDQINHELALIGKLGLAGYFLIVWDIVRFARRIGVLCQGRGSAANSVVCYCLGITAIDPVKMGLLFERFLSEERREAPDIDIDFAHRDREEVLQYVYQRYGREHAAMVCEHITFRGRSAVRDAARVLGFSVEQANVLSTLSDKFSAEATADVLRTGANLEEMTGRRYDLDPQSDRPAKPDDPRKKPYEWTAEKLLTESPKTKDQRPKPSHESRVTSHGSIPDSRFPIPDDTGLDPNDPRVKILPDIVRGLHQIPRHRSIHVGGFVLTREPLRTVVPIEPASMPGRTVIQWERDDLDSAGLVKIDLLGLGMLTVLQDCLKYILAARGVSLDLAALDMTDQAVYDDLCRADTIGVFQVESRAQMNTLPRLQPRCFYDLVVEVALIRPGPIQGDMVNPYLRRRLGEEAVTFAHPSLEPVLKRTLGVPLFQEQGMQVAVTAAGFTPGQADVLRKAMGHKRSREKMAAICEQLIEGMKKNGIEEETAKRIYNQINAFADYGFPESHAASFALIVYASAYLRHYYAPEFLAAMLNAQPMGFYSVGTLIEDARRHGVKVRPIDLTASAWDHSLELSDGRMVVPSGGVVRTRAAGSGQRAVPSHESPATSRDVPVVRLGLRLVRGLGHVAREKLERALADGPFADIHDFVRRSGVDQGAVRALCEAGAFDSMVADQPPAQRRRVALWRALDAMRGEAGPLAPRPKPEPRGQRPEQAPPSHESRVTSHESIPDSRFPIPDSHFPAMTRIELTDADYRMTGLSLNGHPMRHLRKLLSPNAIRTADDLMRNGRDGERVAHAGLVIVRQRPGTAKGFVFLSMEDETGILNVVVTPKRFERQALLISNSPLLLVRGTLQVEHGVVNLRGETFHALKADAGEDWAKSHDFH
ncbi:MAG TPA: PHP domain-containing protein [Gemmatimonadaceae bacterium]|nr:PHP domain-containing protein [Gemmatimonadaceae bacterium]